MLKISEEHQSVAKTLLGMDKDRLAVQWRGSVPL